MSDLNMWDHAILKAHKNLMIENDTKEVGKIRQQANEYMQQAWINQHTSLQVSRQSELRGTPGYDTNESSWDLIDDRSAAPSLLKIQSKYRGGKSTSSAFHMEQTRRNSHKNAGEASSSGHVSYSREEFDVALFTRPAKIVPEFNGDDDLVAIPEYALRDPKRPGFLYRVVPMSVVRQWADVPVYKVLEDLRREKLRGHGA